jgi:flagellar protein FlbD
MIKLTRLGGEAFILNAELIKYVESRPDTYITLVPGERLVVEETPDEVMRRALEYQQTKQLLPTKSERVSK